MLRYLRQKYFDLGSKEVSEDASMSLCAQRAAD